MLTDTIAAIATPLGQGGLAVIRISGGAAFAIADRCFAPAGRQAQRPSAAGSHTVHYGHVVREGRPIDEVLLTLFRAPRTFTREDVVEISCHGGVVSTQEVLRTVLAAGARVAEPGEFTKRAFLNGRIDLTQAEAVADLIHAQTELALAAAQEQLEGKLSQRIHSVRDDLVKTLAHVEAHLDFPDEDIQPDTQEQLLLRLQGAAGAMETLLNTAQEGQLLRRGIRAAIIGRPNSGKSSLLNQLLGQDRAIVSPIPGTTRDTIQETANIRGIPVVFIDTAGLRESDDAIEREGIRRSLASLATAELILLVIDRSEPLSDADQARLVELATRKVVVVCNKADLARRLELPATFSQHPMVETSCSDGGGIESLKDTICRLARNGELNPEMSQVTINSRHQEALRRAREATLQAAHALRQGMTLEVVAMELRIAVNAVGEIVGKTTTEDLLDSIFSQFCIGK